ncbi:hypothetical protein D9613_008243 [Agrocybe pediades]|uniref:Uncharacterized protein n=1 Tax=Agrocybe pediades TaxID=84607 RepID=A0A8H4VQA1_9AGAR|nr:hypothetical protein D9613_008243 [Agrocybe pediades]
MLTCYAVVVAYAGWTFFSNVEDTKSSVVHAPNGDTCSFPRFPPLLYTFWITMLGFEGILCALAIYRGFRTLKEGLPRELNGMTLIDLIVRDSIIIFVVLAATYVTCLIVFLKAPVTRTASFAWHDESNADNLRPQANLTVIPAGFSISLSVVLGCRMILNLREAAVIRTGHTIPMSTLVIGGNPAVDSQATVESEFEV